MNTQKIRNFCLAKKYNIKIRKIFINYFRETNNSQMAFSLLSHGLANFGG